LRANFRAIPLTSSVDTVAISSTKSSSGVIDLGRSARPTKLVLWNFLIWTFTTSRGYRDGAMQPELREITASLWTELDLKPHRARLSLVTEAPTDPRYASPAACRRA
jgi:hypothetical protein